MESKIYQDFGERLKARRIAAGLTQEALASCIGLGRTSITNMEKGRQPVTLSVFVDIAMALGVQPVDLLPEVSPPALPGKIEKNLSEFDQEIQDNVRRFLVRNSRG